MIPKLSSYELPNDSELPKNKINWSVDPSRAALLIHDMQEYFCDFWGDNSPLIESLVNNIKTVRNFCKSLGIPVYYTAQPGEQSEADRALLTDMWGPGITKEPTRAGIVAGLTPDKDDTVLMKWRYSAFQRSGFEEILKSSGRDQLIICGIYAHIGCLTTAVDAFMRDIQPFFVADALADFSREKHLIALQMAAGTCARVTNVKQLTVPQSLDELRSTVFSLLEDEDEQPEDDESLLDYGLDSVKIMALASRWRLANPSIDFVKLADNPNINTWWALLSPA